MRKPSAGQHGLGSNFQREEHDDYPPKPPVLVREGQLRNGKKCHHASGDARQAGKPDDFRHKEENDAADHSWRDEIQHSGSRREHPFRPNTGGKQHRNVPAKLAPAEMNPVRGQHAPPLAILDQGAVILQSCRGCRPKENRDRPTDSNQRYPRCGANSPGSLFRFVHERRGTSPKTAPGTSAASHDGGARPAHRPI